MSLSSQTEHHSVALKTAFANLAAVLIFGTASILLFGLPIIGNLSQRYIGEGHDPSIYMWSLIWWPHALSQHLNPFLTKVIWAPTGTNLAWATTMPAVSLASYPLVRLFGLVVTYNVLCLLAPVLSAWSAFVLCRYVSGSISASLVGGYVLGFSTYFVGHLLGGHLVLVLAFPIPIALYLACRHFDGSITRPWFVPLFTLTIAILFLTEVELFATVMLFGMATACVFRLLADAHEAEKLRYVAKSVVISMATASIILSPYLYHMFAHGFPRRAMNSPKAYAADILNFAIPTPVSLLGISPLLQNIARRFSGGFGEATSYVGPVLLFIVYRFWRSDRARLGSRVLLWLLAIICIASIGPMIHISGVSIVPTPWTIVVALPIVKHALPARFSVLMFLDLALIVALYLAAQKPALRLVLGILVVVSLLPNPWYLRGQEVDTPVFFSNGIYRQWLAPNEIVLVLPYGLAGNSMLWQAQSDMYFRMQGGYVSTQIPDAFRGEQIVQSLEHNVCFGNCAEQFLAFVDEHQVGAVVVPERYEREWSEFLSRMPSAPIRVSGVALYQLAPRH